MAYNHRSTILAKASSGAEVANKAENLDKIAGFVIDTTKTIAQALSLDIEALKKAGFTVDKLYFAIDTGKIVIDVVQNGMKIGIQASDWQTDSNTDTKIIDNIAGATKAVLSLGQLNLASSNKETLLILEDDDVAKAATEGLGIMLEAMNLELLKSGNLVNWAKSTAIDIVALGAKSAVKAALSTYLANNTSNVDAEQFAYDYLNAYYSSGGDAAFMKNTFQMPININEAAKNKLDADWVEVIAGNGMLGYSTVGWLSTKENFGIAKVKYYLNTLNEGYAETVNHLGGLPGDDIYVKFNNSADVIACEGYVTDETLLITESKKSNNVVIPATLTWDISEDVTSTILGTRAQLTFSKAGTYTVNAYAFKQKSSNPFPTGKTYLIKQCVLPSTSAAGGNVKVLSQDATSMTYLATVNSGYTFDGWYDATGKLMSATPTVKFSYATALKDSQLTPKFTKQGTTPPASGKLNDTGIVWGGNYPNGNNTTCIGETIASQDCSTGRDVTNNDPSDGHAGFSFTKLSKTGASLAATATDWACIKDNVTGLVWENKTTDGGIHDTNKIYRWGGVGAQIVDGKTFGTRYADWDVLVNGSNSEKLCGFSDWRMPSRNELHSIINYNTYNPAIDTAFFANTQSGFYWSSSPNAYSSYYAWGVGFSYGGGVGNVSRYYGGHARLVRGGQ